MPTTVTQDENDAAEEVEEVEDDQAPQGANDHTPDADTPTKGNPAPLPPMVRTNPFPMGFPHSNWRSGNNPYNHHP